MLLLSILLAGQSMVTEAPALAAPRPATSWSCQFNDAAGDTFELNGLFAEVPAGAGANSTHRTMMSGTGPGGLLGARSYTAFESDDRLRTYMMTGRDVAGAGLTMIAHFTAEENGGLATITRYVADVASGRGRLHAFATGNCSATFHPTGYSETGQ